MKHWLPGKCAACSAQLQVPLALRLHEACRDLRVLLAPQGEGKPPLPSAEQAPAVCRPKSDSVLTPGADHGWVKGQGDGVGNDEPQEGLDGCSGEVIPALSPETELPGDSLK